MKRVISLNASYLELDMPYKSREQDYHLTPVGWTTNEITSAYTIETWRHSVYREFAWSKEQHAWRRVWHNLAWSETERERFRQTFAVPAQLEATPPSVTEPLPEGDAERKRA